MSSYSTPDKKDPPSNDVNRAYQKVTTKLLPRLAVSSSSVRRSKTDKQGVSTTSKSTVQQQKVKTTPKSSKSVSASKCTTQWLSRLPNNKSTYIGPVTHKTNVVKMRPKPVHPKPITPSRDDIHYAHMHVDLTMDTKEQELLPGAPFSTIKNRHKLFYSYDPERIKGCRWKILPSLSLPKKLL